MIRCQLPGGGCPVDLNSVVPGFPVPSPFEEFFDGICPTDSNGFYSVCVYTCVTTEAVSCVTNVNSVPGGTSVSIFPEPIDVNIGNIALGFPPPPPPLQNSELGCKPPGDPTVVFGPLVSPTLGELPATCNGVPCPSVCNIPGQQLGAPVGFGETVSCPAGGPSCFVEAPVSEKGEV